MTDKTISLRDLVPAETLAEVQRIIAFKDAEIEHLKRGPVAYELMLIRRCLERIETAINRVAAR